MFLEVHELSKRFGSQSVFEGVSRRFEADQVYGIIGGNGSGKSSFLHCCCGYLAPDTGRITTHGPTSREQLLLHSTMASPALELFEAFTVGEQMDFHFTMVDPIEGHDKESIISGMDIHIPADRPIGKLSSGMRQRIKLALSLYSQRPFLFLDEPCSNLDSSGCAWFNQTLSATKKGRVVLIASNEHPEEMKQCGDSFSIADYHR